jgi:hypothetical protein
MGATVEGIIGFDAVPDDLTFAMVTDRGEFVNRALEAVERVRRASSNQLEGKIVIVAANFTFCHHTSHCVVVLLPWLIPLFSGCRTFEQLDDGGVTFLRRKRYGVLARRDEIPVQVSTFIQQRLYDSEVTA